MPALSTNSSCEGLVSMPQSLRYVMSDCNSKYYGLSGAEFSDSCHYYEMEDDGINGGPNHLEAWKEATR